jgi:excisionase family DNA binding protein
MATISGAAEYWNCTPFFIRQLMHQKKITAYRYGTKFVRVDLNEIKAVFEQGGRDIDPASNE